MFRQRFPGMMAPYTDSIVTEQQADQNQLLTRFLNYRTGFSATISDYLSAYRDCHGANPPTGSALCMFSKPLNDPTGFFEADTTPCASAQTQAAFIAHQLYQVRKDSLMANFDSLYKAKCLEAKYLEEFFVEYHPREYHYTLYYYDQAGNLVKTLPPAAVKPNFSQSFLDSVVAARNAGAYYDNYRNNEAMATQYRYNTLNQVSQQESPDGGLSKFWYDRLGRLAISQNEKQGAPSNSPEGGGTLRYSYTLYDYLGRITEVGQAAQGTAMTQTISRDTTVLKNWIAAATTEQITRTVYDEKYEPLETIDNGKSVLFQKNLRSRVSYTYVKPLEATTLWDAATFYSYDILGNVDTLLQDYKTGAMANAGNRFKKIVYDFDLISGKVNEVAYQPGAPDEFYHSYEYDAENRLIEVKTSKDKIFWERDADYEYYRHGPLARTILGQQQVQGVDYAYTLQGWLKGVNSTAVTPGFDMGGDGAVGTSIIARDAYGFSLNYFNNDYDQIGSTNPFAATTITNELFNGNIGAISMNIPKLGNAILSIYKYDQLNRLVKSDTYNGLNPSTNIWSKTTIQDYREELSYDPNGNIKTYKRNGTGATLNLNNYSYAYTTNTNRLGSVYNSVNTETKNYVYDEIGNTTSDGMQGVANAKWNVYGKLQSLTNKDSLNVTYTYSADGQRISKKVGTVEEWYVKDAVGNIIATYKKDAAVNGGDLTLSGFYKYGSSLLSVKDANINMQNIVPVGIILFARGNDNYVLSDANGNTKVTVSDKKLQHSSNGSVVDYYLADVRTATLHSSFGANAKTYNGGFEAANFNGQRKSLEIGGDAQTAQFWEYNGDVGRRWNVDPKTTEAPSSTPYNAMWGNPIHNMDPHGAWAVPPGDYYNYNGTYLGSDGINDKKVYLVNSIDPETASKGMSSSDLLGIRDNLFHSGSTDPLATLLPITHYEFQTISNIVKHEGVTNDANEYLWVAHASNNAASADGKSLYNKLMSGYSSVPKADKIPLSVSDKSTTANYARAAVLNVMSGGTDPTGGATLWDGTDFLSWGLKSPNGTPQNKFEEYKSITISGEIYNRFLKSQLSKYTSAKVRYYGSYYDIPADVFMDKSNWKDGSFFYNTGQNQPYGLRATGSAGRSIFWKKEK